MPEQLLQAVRELTRVVEELKDTLEEYPKRGEVEEKFATKAESKTRRNKALAIGLTITFISFFASFVVTVSTVTTCFLSDEARSGKAPATCNLLPGYPEAQADNQRILRELHAVFKATETNDERLQRVEKRLDLPPLKH